MFGIGGAMVVGGEVVPNELSVSELSTRTAAAEVDKIMVAAASAYQTVRKRAFCEALAAENWKRT